MNMNILRTICNATELNIVFFYLTVISGRANTDPVLNVVGTIKNI